MTLLNSQFQRRVKFYSEILFVGSGPVEFFRISELRTVVHTNDGPKKLSYNVCVAVAVAVAVAVVVAVAVAVVFAVVLNKSARDTNLEKSQGQNSRMENNKNKTKERKENDFGAK